MQFLNVSRRRTESFTDEQFAAMVAEEAQQARTLYAEGFVRQIWHRSDIAGACMLLEADSAEHAHVILNRLPMVAAGMLEVNVIPLKPYAGFSPR